MAYPCVTHEQILLTDDAGLPHKVKQNVLTHEQISLKPAS